MKYLLLMFLLVGCGEYNQCVKGKMYWCSMNSDSDCQLMYKTSAKITPKICTKRELTNENN